MKRQRGTHILLAAGNLSGSVVKTFDGKEKPDISDVTRILITTFIKEPVSTTLSLFDYIHFFMACYIRSILILFSHLQLRLLRALLYRDADKSLARLEWKKNWNVAIFLPTRRSLLPRRPGWTDKLRIFFFMGLQKLEFGRCSLFLSWSG